MSKLATGAGMGVCSGEGGGFAEFPTTRWDYAGGARGVAQAMAPGFNFGLVNRVSTSEVSPGSLFPMKRPFSSGPVVPGTPTERCSEDL